MSVIDTLILEGVYGLYTWTLLSVCVFLISTHSDYIWISITDERHASDRFIHIKQYFDTSVDTVNRSGCQNNFIMYSFWTCFHRLESLFWQTCAILANIAPDGIKRQLSGFR